MDKWNYKKAIIFTAVLLVVVTVFSVSFAYFTVELREGELFTTQGGVVPGTLPDISYTENVPGISLAKTYPMPDENGRKLKDSYTYTITNNDTTKSVDVTVAFEVLKNSTLEDNLVNYLFGDTVRTFGGSNTTSVTESSYETSYIIDTFSLKAGESKTTSLKFWINENGTLENAQNKTWAGRVVVTAAFGTSLEEKLDKLNIKVNPNNPTNFADPATTDETADGLFSMADDYGTSYYYRGTAPNNYIKFGKDASGQDMWWRIIRFNGDGSIRMQYDGSGASGSNTYTRSFALTNQLWNSASDDAKYVGWMFGGTDGSASTSREEAQRNEISLPIKIAVDDWYKANIVDTGYNDYVQDAIFCNDRSTPGKSATGWTDDTGLGYGSNTTAYGAYARSGVQTVKANNVRPQFTCPQENDKFTVNVENGGNGGLTYPVGLITADEIVAAGSGRYGTSNSSYYLYKGSWYWSLSPLHFDGYARPFVVHSNGSLNNFYVNDTSGAVAPVINLKPEYVKTMVGNGTINNPYRDANDTI